MAQADLTALISEAKKRSFSLIPSVSESDVKTIWNYAAIFIKTSLLNRKGVIIPGFGTLSFAESKSSVGHKVLQIHRPVLILSESFIQSHGLSQTKIHPLGSTPIVKLNYTAICSGTTFTRDTVELTIKEIFLSLSFCIYQGKNIQLEFPEIGRMCIREKKVKMKFFLEFIRLLDKNGELEQYFRPSTSWLDPRAGSMVQSSNATRQTTAPLPVLEKPKQPVSDGSPKSEHAEDTTAERPGSQQHKSTSTTLPSIPTATLISSSDKNDHTSSPPPTSGQERKPAVPDSKTSPHKQKDLCLVCDDRDKRNVFLDFSAEKRRRQKEYEDMMWDYQRKTKEMGDLKESLRKKRWFDYNKDQSAFNWSMATKQKHQKRQRSPFHPSYLLDQRLLTPPKHLEREEYRKDLTTQINAIQLRLQEVEEEKKQAEKEYQKELAASLAAMQALYCEQKAEEVAKYHKALTDQVRAKHEKVDTVAEKTVQKYPVFGVDDIYKQRRHWDKEHKQYNLEAAEKKLKKTQQKAMEEKQEGEEMLKRAKDALIGDLLAARHMRIMDRKRLQDNWAFTVEHRKRLADLERQNSRGLGLQLLQQCDRYRRCSQCQRRRYRDTDKNVDDNYVKPRHEAQIFAI